LGLADKAWYALRVQDEIVSLFLDAGRRCDLTGT
jgi:hypothetical protein